VVLRGHRESRQPRPEPLLSTLQNHPLGVNMMANTAMFGLSVPLAPVTWRSARRHLALILTLGMARERRLLVLGC